MAPLAIVVESDNTSSVLEVESQTIDSVDYLIGALQNHLKTADPLCVEYFEETTQSYSSLTDVGVESGRSQKTQAAGLKGDSPFVFVEFG